MRPSGAGLGNMSGQECTLSRGKLSDLELVLFRCLPSGELEGLIEQSGYLVYYVS